MKALVAFIGVMLMSLFVFAQEVAEIVAPEPESIKEVLEFVPVLLGAIKIAVRSSLIIQFARYSIDD